MTSTCGTLERMEQAGVRITEALAAARLGDRDAFNTVFSAVHGELRRLARAQRRRHSPDATLDTTALVHETYLKLALPANLAVEDRGHFFALAARAMRQILITSARKRLAQKRGGGHPLLSRPEAAGEAVLSVASPFPLPELLAIHQSLERLEEMDADLARLVELRFFAGLTEEEVAELRGVSSRTVRRDWKAARAFLLRQLGTLGEGRSA
ncbi:MAG TPA: ECF-type sigma factor [Thermoanaerobaculia bacterium]|nr:ECF-type sigma factor [Thermoanaerobaculia bacterium]